MSEITTSFMSPTIAELAKALSRCQGMLVHAKKDVENTFFKSHYATLANVLDAAKAPLAENGLAVTQTTDLDAEGNITLSTTLIHSSGEWINSRYPVDPVKRDPQGYGSALSYARRYAVSALIGIASADDDGEGAMGRGKGHSSNEHDQRQMGDRKPALPATKPLPTNSFKNAETVSTPKPTVASTPIPTDGPGSIQSWKSIRCHIGTKGGRVEGKELGSLAQTSMDWIKNKLDQIKEPSQQDNILIAAMAMRDAEMAPKPAQAELGSAKPNLSALQAKCESLKIPLPTMAKVSGNLGGTHEYFADIDESTAGHMLANWNDTMEAVAFEQDDLPK